VSGRERGNDAEGLVVVVVEAKVAVVGFLGGRGQCRRWW
jgi:hypothetical protein